jgi:hypothetical protein
MNRRKYALPALLSLAFLSSGDLHETFSSVQEYSSEERVTGAHESHGRGELELCAQTDKHRYRPGEKIVLEVRLTNTSREPIFLYALLERGPMGSLEVRVLDEKGQEIFPDLIEEFFPLPPKDRTEFVILHPNYFLGVRSTQDTDYWNIDAPGKYKVIVEYHSPIPKRDGLGLNIWPREKGSIFSEPIEIEVVAAE